jgi:hypothetical protein
MTLPASIVEPIAVFMADAPDDCRRCRLGPRPEIDDDVEVDWRVDTVAKVEPLKIDCVAHLAGIAKVQEWLGHANIATTRIYDHRRTRPEDSPTFKAAY